MNIADELQRLQELHRTGALTDAEFTRAKEKILAGQPAPAVVHIPYPMTRPWRQRVPWGWLLLSTFLIFAMVTNPSEEQLQQAASAPENRDALAKAVGDANFWVERTVQRKNRLLFSFGTVRVRDRLAGREGYAIFIGAFGSWYLSFPIESRTI